MGPPPRGGGRVVRHNRPRHAARATREQKRYSGAVLATPRPRVGRPRTGPPGGQATLRAGPAAQRRPRTVLCRSERARRPSRRSAVNQRRVALTIATQALPQAQNSRAPTTRTTTSRAVTSRRSVLPVNVARALWQVR